jgi:hypothetical protein
MGRIVAYQPGGRDIDVTKEYGNVGIVGILHTLWVIMDKYGGMLVFPLQSVKSPVRPSLLEGEKF